MRTIYFTLLYLLLVAYNAAAQNNYNNHWFFWNNRQTHFGNTNTIENFSPPNMPITPSIYRNIGASEQARTAVSDPQTGALLFYVAIPFVNTGNGNKIMYCFYNKNGLPMPNGQCFMTTYLISNGQPIVIPHPQDTAQYYVFTTLNNGLQYSIVDLRLDSGNGDIINNQKLIPLMPNGTVNGLKMTTAPTCKGTLLIINSLAFTGYVSFNISSNGLATQPIFSPTGSLPAIAYHDTRKAPNTMKASSDGKLLAVATLYGLELYDIISCNGTITNARIIDTTMHFGACFSPDNQLLYTTRAEYQTGYFESSEIVQWDVSLADDVNAVKNSETVLLVNSAYDWPDWVSITSSFMGDIAQGKDGKLYILSNTVYADSVQQIPTPMPPTSIVPWAQTMHIIHQPNNRGMTSIPERDAHYLLGDYKARGGFLLPQPIYPVPNANMDTTYGGVKNITQCFGQPVILQTPQQATCINWSTGSDSKSIHAQDTGWYWVRYNMACQVHLDSFYVNNIPIPQIPEYLIACPEQAILDIKVAPNNSHNYHYDLGHTHRNDPRKVQTDSHWTWYKLLPGQYTLHLKSGSCDTTLSLFVDTFPRPQVAVQPQDNTLAYGDSILLNASGAYLYNWFPTISLDTGTDAQVWARPTQTTQYEVIGINEYGCRDTAYTKITLDHSMEFFIPNAFSPNGDGLNDVFRLEGLSYQRLTEWGIYNRYGEQVFFTTNIQDSWDGTYRGQPCDAGVYYYYIQFFRTDGKLEERRGEVHLVR